MYTLANNTMQLAKKNIKNILDTGVMNKRKVGQWCMKKNGYQDILESHGDIFVLTNPLHCITSQHCLSAEIETEDYLLGLNPGFVHFSNWSFYAKWLCDDGKYPYTYGGRGGKYLPDIIKKLKDDPTTRHAVINIWEKQSDITKMFVPCGTQWVFDIVDNKLNMYVTVRSQDACRGFFLDTFAYPFIQHFIACQLNIKCGKYYHIVLNSHIYDDDIQFAERLLKHLRDIPCFKYGDVMLNLDLFSILLRVSTLSFHHKATGAAQMCAKTLPDFWYNWKANQIIYAYTKYIKKEISPVSLTCAGVIINDTSTKLH